MSRLSDTLLKWYQENRRDLPWRDTKDPYRIWISEIILQQTRVSQGYDYFLRFMERFPDVDTLAAAPDDEVMRYWQGLGYYSRARHLHAAAKTMKGQFPTTYEGVRALQGVGDYTAAAICSFAYDMPYAVVDGNVYRVLSVTLVWKRLLILMRERNFSHHWHKKTLIPLARPTTTRPSWTLALCNALPIRLFARNVRWPINVWPIARASWMLCQSRIRNYLSRPAISITCGLWREIIPSFISVWRRISGRTCMSFR